MERLFADTVDAADELLNMEIAQLRQFIKLYETALTKYRLWKNLPRTYELEDFIAYCSRDHYRQAEALALEYYRQNGSYEKSHCQQ